MRSTLLTVLLLTESLINYYSFLKTSANLKSWQVIYCNCLCHALQSSWHLGSYRKLSANVSCHEASGTEDHASSLAQSPSDSALDCVQTLALRISSGQPETGHQISPQPHDPWDGLCSGAQSPRGTGDQKAIFDLENSQKNPWKLIQRWSASLSNP